MSAFINTSFIASDLHIATTLIQKQFCQRSKFLALKVSISSWSRNISDSCNYFASEWNACGSRKVIYSESFFWSPLNWACTFFAQIFLTSFRNQSTNISFLAKKNQGKIPRPPQTYISWPWENWTIMNAAVSGCLRSRNVVRLGVGFTCGWWTVCRWRVLVTLLLSNSWPAYVWTLSSLQYRRTYE